MEQNSFSNANAGMAALTQAAPCTIEVAIIPSASFVGPLPPAHVKSDADVTRNMAVSASSSEHVCAVGSGVGADVGGLIALLQMKKPDPDGPTSVDQLNVSPTVTRMPCSLSSVSNDVMPPAYVNRAYDARTSNNVTFK